LCQWGLVASVQEKGGPWSQPAERSGTRKERYHEPELRPGPVSRLQGLDAGYATVRPRTYAAGGGRQDSLGDQQGPGRQAPCVPWHQPQRRRLLHVGTAARGRTRLEG